MKIEGKVAIVTGASSGIGEQIALALIEHGARVVLAARRMSRLEKVASAAKPPGQALAIETDVTRTDDLKHLVDSAVSHFGGVDILVNNAGTGFGGDLADLEIDEIAYTVSLNLLGPIILSKLALPHLRARQRGLIVNIASFGSFVAAPYFSLYSATKFGLNGFSQSLRRQLMSSNVGVMTVYPGAYDTEMLNPEIKAKSRDLGMKITPAHPSQAAKLVMAGIIGNKSSVHAYPFPQRLIRAIDATLPFITDRVFKGMGAEWRGFCELGNAHFRSKRLQGRSDGGPS